MLSGALAIKDAQGEMDDETIERHVERFWKKIVGKWDYKNLNDLGKDGVMET